MTEKPPVEKPPGVLLFWIPEVPDDLPFVQAVLLRCIRPDVMEYQIPAISALFVRDDSNVGQSIAV